jgi:predicted dehydrogenase
MADFAWAIVGPGAIAQKFAEAINAMPDTYLHTVCGRDLERAKDFANGWRANGRAPLATTQLQALLADERIDGIYVATPHSHHADVVGRCLNAGKAVLCEKPLVPNHTLAQELVALAHERQVFLMEALWTRFLPMYAIVGDWLNAQKIGKIRAIQSHFCFNCSYDANSRLFDPSLAGGSLLDIGVYNLAVTRWVLEMALGACPEPVSMKADGLLAPTGVDQRVTGTLIFPEGVSSQFICAFDSTSSNSMHIIGELGSISLPRDFNAATQAILQLAGAQPQVVNAPMRINGFEGEIEEAMRCIRLGLIESPQMPHAETLAIVKWMDEFRRQLGIRYPFE